MGYKCSICGKEFDSIEKLIKDLEAHQAKEIENAKEEKRKEEFSVIQTKLDELTALIDNYNLKYNKEGYGIGYTTEFTNPKTSLNSIAQESGLEKFLKDSLKQDKSYKVNEKEKELRDISKILKELFL